MLSGVPETALWTLYHRALAARQGVLDDPKALELVERIDHPFAERFGGGELAPWQGLRVRAFDREIRRFLHTRPDATVVALGEGLETQFWRVDNGRVHWVTVDLPESVALRERLLPAGERQTTITASALDVDAWIGTRPSLITAQGLLMYLDREAVHGLFARLEPAVLLFDLVSKRLAAHSRKPREGYQPPAWTYGVDKAELASLPVRDLQRVALPHGRGPLAGVRGAVGQPHRAADQHLQGADDRGEQFDEHDARDHEHRRQRDERGQRRPRGRACDAPRRVARVGRQPPLGGDQQQRTEDPGAVLRALRLAHAQPPALGHLTRLAALADRPPR